MLFVTLPLHRINKFIKSKTNLNAVRVVNISELLISFLLRNFYLL